MVETLNQYFPYHMQSCDGFDVFSIEFVRPKHGFFVPISPVYVILECCNWKRMSKGIGRMENQIASSTVVITWWNYI